jgi:hypothetical protein
MPAELLQFPKASNVNARWSIDQDDIAALSRFCMASPRGYQWEVKTGDSDDETYVKLQSNSNSLSILLILPDTLRMTGWVGMDRDGVVFSSGDTVKAVIGRLCSKAVSTNGVNA